MLKKLGLLLTLLIALLVVAGYLAVMLAARIYRVGLLMYGKRPLEPRFQQQTFLQYQSHLYTVQVWRGAGG